MDNEDKKISNLRTITRYANNPLVTPREIKTKQKSIRAIASGRLVDPTTGEEAARTALMIRKTVDDQHFVKVFSEGVKAAYELSPSGYKVFQLVLKATQCAAVGEDKIYLHFMDAVEDPDMPISRQTFHRGMKELLEKDFIAASDRPGMYWINPHLFFKGDRVSFIHEFVRRKKEDLSPDELDRDELEKRGQKRLVE